MMFLVASSSASGADRAIRVADVLDRVRAHEFHPVDERSFTIDRHLKQHGIADLNDNDWQVRLLALRDLVRAGPDNVPQIVAGLKDQDVQVRYVCATALGALKAQEAADELERVVREDADALARSQAVVALGQIESERSLGLLREREHLRTPSALLLGSPRFYKSLSWRADGDYLSPGS